MSTEKETRRKLANTEAIFKLPVVQVGLARPYVSTFKFNNFPPCPMSRSRPFIQEDNFS